MPSAIRHEQYDPLLKRILNGRLDYSELLKPPRPDEQEPEPPQKQTARRRITPRKILQNVPLMVGLLIVAVLFFLVLFGPLWAPENPYLVGTTTLTMVDGTLQSPPFPPSGANPLGSDQWGRDILSLLLYGARNTLVAAVFITLARVILGTVLGIISGWNEGKASDQAIMGTVGITSSIPLLLTGMLVIFALDIRRGIVVFLIALCVVGWGEIAQYIRGEFITLRQRPFIEGARAMGLTGAQTAIRHVLPNILPALVVITLLEMGATLLLLGELGFVGVFMGGGTAQESNFITSATIPDIPEWGAMMADSRVWARGRPWMVFYPGLAFFLAVLGFNALGEGLRRLMERGSFNTNFILSKKMLLIVAVVVAATWYIVGHVGPAPSYAQLARTFDGDAALAHAAAIVELGDRRPGTPGNDQTADYIAARFEEYGMQPGGGGRSYFQTVDTRLVEALSPPALALLDADGQPLARFTHLDDFAFRIDGHGGSGTATAPVTVVTFDPQQRQWPVEVFAGMDLRDQIVLVRGDNAPEGFSTEALIRGARAVLTVEEDAYGLRDQVQLAELGADYVRRPTLPVLAITPEAAERLLAASGSSLAAVDGSIEAQKDQTPWQLTPLTSQAQVSVELSEPRKVALRNVMGLFPGQDVALDRELLVVLAHYDSPGDASADGVVYQSADDSAAAVAAMLEIGRLWHEQDYTPRRSVLFVALTGSELDYSGAEAFATNYAGPAATLVDVAGFSLARLAAGGDRLEISDGPQRVADLFENNAATLDVAVQRGEPLSHRYQEVLRQNLPVIVVQRTDSAVPRADDTLERLDAELLREAGEAINLTLITASRDASW
ncbi:MAG: ABC transporter permease subunit [Caldilineales bacterium]